MALNQRTNRSTAAVRARLNRRVIPLVLVAFAVIGFIGFFALRTDAREALYDEQIHVLEDVTRDMADNLEEFVVELTPLATNPTTRAFTDLPMDAPTYAAIRDQLASTFISVMEEESYGIVSIRLIMPDGRVQAEVSRTMSGSLSIAGDETGLGRSFFGDPWFLRVLSTSVDDILLSRMLLLTGIDDRPISPLTPIFRLSLPVREREMTDTLQGVIQMDIRADAVFSEMDILVEPGRRLVLTNSDGEVIHDTGAPSTSYLLNFTAGGIPQIEGAADVPGRRAGPAQISVLDYLEANPGELDLAEAGPYLITTSVLHSLDGADMPWRLAIADDTTIAFSAINTRSSLVLAITLVLGVVVSITASGILTRILAPLDEAAHLAERLAGDGRVDPAQVSGEEGHLSHSLARISGRLTDLSSQMEQQRSRLTRNLEMAARIGRETAMLSDLDTLLNRAIELICVEYGFYHAQVFLVDDAGLNAVLVYSRGEAGRRLLEKQHKLAVGSESVIGRVTASGQPYIVNDTVTGGGEAHSFNPLLPDTRAEMALPLRIGDMVIGALDVQSTEIDAFDQEELRAFQLLADQLAIAVHSAHLLMESEQRVEQIDRLNQQYIHDAWTEVDERFGLERVYRYDLREITTEAAPPSDHAMSVPIRIRGEMIGMLDAAVPTGQNFTEDDHALMTAVAERVALALENARLHHETQFTLNETSQLYDLNRKLNEAEELEDILVAIADSVMKDASSGQILEFEAFSAGQRPQHMTVSADWNRSERNWEEATLAGLEIDLDEYPFLSRLPADQIILIEDMERDIRLDEALRVIFRSVGAAAAVIIPLNVRGVWRGLIIIEFAEPRGFTPQEGRIFTALIDQAGVAVDNRLLLRQTEMTVDQLERLYGASREINTAQRMPDLVGAMLASQGGLGLNFALTLLEGALDNNNWPTRERLIALSEGLNIHEMDQAYDLRVAGESPLREREPSVIDIEAEGEHAPSALVQLFRARGVQYCAIFPLFSANQPVALFYVLSDQPYEMTMEDYEVYKALTGQMSTVLQNRRLLEQTAQALDESRRLYAASRAINTALDAGSLYPAVASHLVAASNQVMRLTILLTHPNPVPDAPYLECAHVWTRVEDMLDSPPVGARLPREEAPYLRFAVEVEGTAYLQDIDLDLVSEPALRAKLKRAETASLLIAPLVSRQKWFGAVVAEGTQPRGFDDQYIRFIQAVADQLAIAIENAHLFEDAQREARRALALAEVGQLATRIGSDFTRNINEVFATVAQAAEYDRWVLALTDEEHPQRLRVAAQMFDGASFMDDAVFFDLGEDSVHTLTDAFLENRMLLVNDPRNYPTLTAIPGMDELVGKHIAAPVRVGDAHLGSLLVGRDLNAPDLTEADEQLVGTLAAQVAVAVENRRLFQTAESERQTLRSILETMPSGVLVLDAATFMPIQYNSQLEHLLGRPLVADEPFDTTRYELRRTGTHMSYVDAELPIHVTAQTGEVAFIDDIVVMRDGIQTDLLMNSAPIRDTHGNVSAIVAVLENISSLRGLENALQDNLRETIMLYEATRALSEAEEITDVLDTIIMQLAMYGPDEALIITFDAATGNHNVARALMGDPETITIPGAALDDYSPRMIVNAADHDDLSADARALLSEAGITALATVPLRVRTREEPIGWLATAYSMPHDFKADEERFLSTLADSAAVALDNRYLFDSTQNALREASILYQASRALTDATGPEDVIDAAINHLNRPEITQVFMVQLSTAAWDSPGAIATVVTSWTADDDTLNLNGILLTAEDFPAWDVLASPNTLLFENIEASGALTDLEKMSLSSLGINALVVMPLRVPGRALGAICLGATETLSFTERDERIYRAFAEQTSLNLEAARLLDQTEYRARQLQTSAQVSQFASSVLDLDTLLPRLVDLIREAFQYDHVQIFLMDHEDDYAELRASTGEAGRQLLTVNHKLQKGSNSVIGTVTAENRPVVALDTGLAGVVHKPNPYLPHTRSELALPLVIKGKVVGALDVQSNESNAFDDDDINVLTTLAAQISVAIDNARLFQQSESRANDMSLLFAVTTAAASATTLEGALNNVTEDLRDSLNALSVAIYLPVTYIDELTEASTAYVRPIAVAGITSDAADLPEITVGTADNVVGIAAGNFRSLIINKIQDQPLYHAMVETARSAVVVPLTSGSELIGLITMEDSRPYAYNHETLTLLQTMGGTLSALIQNQQLLERLQTTNEQLREMDRIKSEFLANMSHELRTPLNSIIGFSRVILKGIDGPLTEMQEQDLSTIYNSGQHLLGLINDLLDQAKIAAGKMELKPDFFDVKSVVEGVRSIGIGLVKDKPISIGLELESGLPEVYGDEFRTRQVLLNLISNSAKFTSDGSITLAVYTFNHPETGRMVRVDVRDTGIGIAEKDMPLLFEAFRQVDSSLTRTAGGTGLGLPISKSLVEMQGGEMLVSSKVNAGSTFSITIPTMKPDAEKPPTGQLGDGGATADDDTLPVAEATADDEHDTLRMTAPAHTNGDSKRETADLKPVQAQQQPPPPTMAKRQVLVIEENPDRLDQFRRVIQREGFDVFAASIPLEAEAMASGLRPTLIVLDVNFANGAGWNILTKLKDRDDTFDIPVIVVTLSDEQDRIMELGAYAYLQQPVAPDQLVEAVVSAEQDSNTERILIIDDQPESARLLKQLLDQHGKYRVFSAENGPEGVSMVARRRPDLVLLDLRMPEMDGFAVLNELRSNPETASIPVLIVTGDTLNEDEMDQLANTRVLSKSDISYTDFRRFIQGVEVELYGDGD